MERREREIDLTKDAIQEAEELLEKRARERADREAVRTPFKQRPYHDPTRTQARVHRGQRR